MSDRPTFDDLDRKPDPRVCVRCGGDRGRGEAAGQVSIIARRLGPGGRVQGSKTKASLSRSLCEPCTVEVFTAVREEFTRQLREGP